MIKIDSVAGYPSFESYSSVKTEVRRFKKQLVFNDIDDALAAAKAKLGGDEFDCWDVPSEKCSSVTVSIVEGRQDMLRAVYSKEGIWEITIRFIVKFTVDR